MDLLKALLCERTTAEQSEEDVTIEMTSANTEHPGLSEIQSMIRTACKCSRAYDEVISSALKRCKDKEHFFTLFFFFLRHASYNGPIINDYSHFEDQASAPSELYRFKLNLANWPDKRDLDNLKRWEIV